MNTPQFVRLVVYIGALACQSIAVRAQFAVAVAIDVPATLEWVAEETYWSSELKALAMENATLRANNSELTKANTTLRDLDVRLGSPTEGAKLAFGGYTAADTPSRTFITEALTRADLVSKPSETDGILASLRRVDDLRGEATGVDFEVARTRYDRDLKRYRVSADEEKLRDAVVHAVQEFQNVQLKELDFQKKQSEGMAMGTLTMSEVEARGTALESSQGRVDLARNRLELARAELESFLGQVKVEQRKMQTASLEELQRHKTNEHERADKMRARVGL